MCFLIFVCTERPCGKTFKNLSTVAKKFCQLPPPPRPKTHLRCVAAAAAWAAALPLVCHVDLFPAEVKLPVKAVVEVVADLLSHLLLSLRLEQLLRDAANVLRGVVVPFDVLGDGSFVASRVMDRWRLNRHRRDAEHVIWCAANLLYYKEKIKDQSSWAVQKLRNAILKFFEPSPLHDTC